MLTQATCLTRCWAATSEIHGGQLLTSWLGREKEEEGAGFLHPLPGHTPMAWKSFHSSHLFSSSRPLLFHLIFVLLLLHSAHKNEFCYIFIYIITLCSYLFQTSLLIPHLILSHWSPPPPKQSPLLLSGHTFYAHTHSCPPPLPIDFLPNFNFQMVGVNIKSFHIWEKYAISCLSDLSLFAWHMISSSIHFPATAKTSFLSMNEWKSIGYTTVSLSIHLLLGIWAASMV